MKEYLALFIDKDYPHFIDKYLNTKTLERLKNVTQFCGCDYTNLYSPLFLYSRFDHSLVVAHMTWHFTHDKLSTIAALLHDAGTPCFAHCIDYVLGDYIHQESSEKNIISVIKEDELLLTYLDEDSISLEVLNDLTKYPVLENSSPKLCTDRLDGVLHTCYVWLHTHSLNDIKKVYDNIEVLINEEGVEEIGFVNQSVAEKFVEMVFVYAKELQGNTDKFVMKYISEIIKIAMERKLITLEDLYTKQENEIIDILQTNFSSWTNFHRATTITRCEKRPNVFCVSFETKKRNTIPLVKTSKGIKRIDGASKKSSKVYRKLKDYQDSKYAYIKSINQL